MTDTPPPPRPDLPPPPSGFPPPPPPSGFGYDAPPPSGYATYGAPSGPSTYAGIWPRFCAYILDWLIVAILFIPAIVVVATGPTKITSCSIDSEGNVTIGEEINGLCEVPTGGTWAAFGLLLTIAIVGAVLYNTLLIGRTGQTWGKRALGVTVVDATTGQPIGNGRALGRFLMGFISRSFCSLGYLWALWDGRKQTWHDKVVSSVVVRA